MKRNKLFRVLALMVCVFMAASLFVGCTAKNNEGDDNDAAATVAPQTAAPVQEVTFWHFNKDEGNALGAGFNKKYQDVKIKVEIIPDQNQSYQTKITQLVNSGGAGMPDVYAAEAAFVKRFVNMKDAYMDLTADASGLTGEMYTYTVDIGKDKTGAIKALSHQAVPGGLGYKRDLAKKVLGTDDPAQVADMVSTSDKLIEVGMKIKGKAKLFAGTDDIWQMYAGARKDPWVKDGKLVIDPKINEFLTFSKKVRDNKLESGIKAWSPGWDSAIKDSNHLFFSIPTWGVPWIIGSKEKPEVKETGRWAIAKPTFGYSWGGTWFGIYSKTTKKDAAVKFVKYLTTDATDTKERVKASGDFCNIKSVNKELAADTTLVNKIINQNPFAVWEPMASSVDGNLITEFDDTCKGEMLSLTDQYLAGKIKTDAEVITKLKEKLKVLFKDAGVVVE